MALTEEARLGAAIQRISEKYLPNTLRANDEAGILRWSLRLADYSTRLALLMSAPIPDEERETSGVTVEWVNNPWPQPSQTSIQAILKALGVEGRVDPGLTDTLSVADNQALSAAGVFHDPLQPVANADYSLFSGVVGEGNGSGVYHAFRNGVDFAQSEPWNSDVGPFDTVALWNEVA